MQYLYIKIKTKFIKNELSIFLIIIDLIKTISFIIVYHFLKKYKKYNLFYLIVFGFFISFCKIIYLILFIFLDYPFKKTLNNYCLSILNNLIINYDNFRIESSSGVLHFNGKTKLSAIKSILQLYNTHVTSFLKDVSAKDEYIEEVTQRGKNIHNIFSNNFDPNYYSYGMFKCKGVFTSKVNHITKFNEKTNYAYNISTQVDFSEKVISCQTSYSMRNFNSEYARDGLIVTKTSNDLVYIPTTLIVKNQELFKIFAHFCVLETDANEIEKFGLFDMEKIIQIKEEMRYLKEIFNKLNIIENENNMQIIKYSLLYHSNIDAINDFKNEDKNIATILKKFIKENENDYHN